MSVKKLSDHDIALFCRQISMLYKSGIMPEEGISILLSDVSDKNAIAILTEMAGIMQQRQPLYYAADCSKAFPEYVVNMLKVGEESGKLDEVLDALGDYYEREENIRESLRGAVSYPMVMIVMMLVVVLILITKVLPIFAQVFSQLGTGMNAFSQTLLNLGNALNRGSAIVLVLLVLLAALALYMYATEKGKAMYRRFIGRFRFTSSLYESMAAGRFASGMSMMMAGGIDVFQSLDYVEKLVENETMEKKIQNCRKLMLETGMPFADAVKETGIFNDLYSRMVMVGFRSGQPVEVLSQIADHYEEEADRRIYRLISVLEPTLVIILSLIVGVILLSVILPLMGIMSSIG